jgi:hypothetical protein
MELWREVGIGLQLKAILLMHISSKIHPEILDQHQKAVATP